MAFTDPSWLICSALGFILCGLTRWCNYCLTRLQCCCVLWKWDVQGAGWHRCKRGAEAEGDAIGWSNNTQHQPTYLSTLKICTGWSCVLNCLCYHPYLVSMLFADLLSLHFVTCTFLMSFNLVYHKHSQPRECRHAEFPSVPLSSLGHRPKPTPAWIAFSYTGSNNIPSGWRICEDHYSLSWLKCVKQQFM